MPPEAAALLPAPRALPLSPVWRAGLVRLALGWGLLLIAFAGDWATMAALWWQSSSYNHILLVPPIVGWLVWMRAAALARLEPRVWPRALWAVALALLLWVLGALSGFNLLRQAGAVAMLIAAVPLLLGPQVARGLVFPLAYMVFLVPFGDELVPPLQTITARITVWLVRLTQVPATIDGVFINTPAGLFEVAEACSGVKFLIAMIALGVLVGNVCFVRWRRRAGFMALCIAAPIFANGVRAWGTVFVAQYVGAKRAGGIDHLIYGWVFFAVVIALVLGASWRWFDRAADDPMINAERIRAAVPLPARTTPLVAAMLPLALLVAGALAWAHAAEALEAPLPPRIALPEVPGWHRESYAPKVWWEPRATGADHRLLGRYGDAAGHTVDVFFALYAAQGEGRKAGGFGEGALRPDSGWAWMKPGPAAPAANSEYLLTEATVIRLAETSYRTGTLLTGSNVRLKLANIADRLLLRRRPTMLLILSAEGRPGQDSAASIAAFRRALGDEGEWMDRTARLR